MASSEQLRNVSHEKFVSPLCTKELRPKKNNSPRPKLFYSCGRSLLTITHYFCGKAKDLPFPFGQLALSTENTVGSWVQPVVESVESLGLNLLSMADSQLSLIGGVAEYIAPPVSVLFEKAQKLEEISVKMPDIVTMTVDKISERGVTGAVADLWFKFEADLNVQTEKMLRTSENVPLLSSVAILVNAAVSPFTGMVSNLMLKHSEVEVKEISSDDSVVKDVIDNPRDGSGHEAGNDIQLREKTEPLPENHEAIVSKDNQHFEKMIHQDNDEISLEAEENKSELAPIKVTENKSELAPVRVTETSSDPILELFDASWHMRSSIGPSRKKKAGK